MITAKQYRKYKKIVEAYEELQSLEGDYVSLVKKRHVLSNQWLSLQPPPRASLNMLLHNSEERDQLFHELVEIDRKLHELYLQKKEPEPTEVIPNGSRYYWRRNHRGEIVLNENSI